MAFNGGMQIQPHPTPTDGGLIGTAPPRPPLQGAGGLVGATPAPNYQPQGQPYQAQALPAPIQGGGSYGGSYNGGFNRSGGAQGHINGMQDFNQFRDSAFEQFNRQMQPQMAVQRRNFDQDMISRGIEPGSDAYNNAFANFSRQQNDLLSQGAFGAQQQGLAAQNQFAQQDLTREGFANQARVAGIGAGAQRYAADARNRLGFAQLGEQGRQFDNNLGFQYAGLNEDGRQFDINDIFRNQNLDQQGMFGMANLFLNMQGQNMQQQQMQNNFNNQWFNQAGGMVGQAPGASFTPVGGLSQNVINANNMNNQNAANSNSALGNLLGAGFGAAGAAGGFGALFSDERLKKNIKYVGTNGPVNVYEFEYKDENHGKGRFRGVLAQQVAKLIPSAVIKVGDYLAVDYSQLPVDMVSV